MPDQKSSIESLAEASLDKSEFSGHGDSIGAAGFSTEDEVVGKFLKTTGEMVVVDPREHHYGEIRIGCAWENVVVAKSDGFIDHALKSITGKGVDLDLGVLFELQDGGRGAVQAFGKMFGSYDLAPFIALSGDDKTGDKTGDNEKIRINGAQWPAIKRILIYAYIYDGVPDWAAVQPRVHIDVPGEPPFVAAPHTHDDALPICAIAGLENSRNGIKMTNYTEYFAGHVEMDRAFGFGIPWADGAKE